ncbi:IclR family transcriptional regulator [Streptomyces aureus]|uniref:IclR family transcriptional regulator n=1 Tax=Streptomyces aureus TaxID=193461 RepID=UPI00363DBC46
MGETSSFERGLAVLRDLAVTGETTVAATAARVGLPVSTTYRYFRVLREQGYTEEDDGVYRAGPALAGLWGASSVQAHLIETGTAVLRRIVERVGETAVLIIRVGTQALCLRRVEPDKALKYTFGINELLPLYAGAGQRVLLASAPSAVVRQVLGGPLARYTDATPAREQLDAVLPAVRRNGWAVSAENSIPARSPWPCRSSTTARLSARSTWRVRPRAATPGSGSPPPTRRC